MRSCLQWWRSANREARAAKLAAAVDAAEPVNSGPSSSARPWRSAQVPALHFYFFLVDLCIVFSCFRVHAF